MICQDYDTDDAYGFVVNMLRCCCEAKEQCYTKTHSNDILSHFCSLKIYFRCKYNAFDNIFLVEQNVMQHLQTIGYHSYSKVKLDFKLAYVHMK